MKKMLAILLALLMMLSGMATAEETTDNNTNISHMLELCQRVDILLHSDRIVTDLVGDTDAAITEEQKIVNRLRAGNRTMPSAVYYVTGETLLAGFIGDNPDYTDTPEQRRVLQLMPQRILMEQQDTYGKQMLNQMARSTQYPKPDGEPEMGMYIALYADALPMMSFWISDGTVNDMYCTPVLSDKLAACKSAEEVTAWFAAQQMPELACTAGVAAYPFTEDPFGDEGEPVPFERLAEAGNALDELIESRYLQTTWGISDEDVAKLAAYAHEGQSPRSIYRIELMESSMAQILRLTYRSEAPQVLYEVTCSWAMEMYRMVTLFAMYDEYNAGVDAKKDKLGKAARNLTKIDKAPFWAGVRTLYQQGEDEDEESDSLFTDETSETDTPDESLKTEAENFQKLMQEIDARYSLIMNQATQKHLYLDLNERTNAMYVLLYDEGAPILVMSSMENGVSCLHVRYFPTAQLENCQNTTDLMFYFTGNNVPFEVTEILPQGDLADMAEAAQ